MYLLDKNYINQAKKQKKYQLILSKFFNIQVFLHHYFYVIQVKMNLFNVRLFHNDGFQTFSIIVLIIQGFSQLSFLSIYCYFPNILKKIILILYFISFYVSISLTYKLIILFHQLQIFLYYQQFIFAQIQIIQELKFNLKYICSIKQLFFIQIN
ncbi:unnamed protein product (macronuclear) [Paramecium tetraurelia]|uniref:Transmembrane protein n=1 Tax=Paramecium tetraurelia TaxID=5888 RepID=A0D5V2_PARTE|nr:uncharacterized protein GSPATT00013849001 [Paramecium tetraurelia]CAK78419.1 unnamed protein product [Paramecium tetraurelia]|eukprot:XP_001445816.1 hypothetical protein (macronuclear) [Paramecium tetraurelia strain d4-2]